MRKITKTLLAIGLLVILSAGCAVATTSCNRMLTYEDGMFDDNEIYSDDSNNDTFQINSEVDNDDTERY